MLSASLIGSHPFFWATIKVFCSHIRDIETHATELHQLKTQQRNKKGTREHGASSNEKTQTKSVSSLTCPLPSEFWPCYLYEHPISKVEITGLVTGYKQRDQFENFWIDDGTGLVCTTMWSNNMDGSLCDHLPVHQVKIGDFVTVVVSLKPRWRTTPIQEINDPHIHSVTQCNLDLVVKQCSIIPDQEMDLLTIRHGETIKLHKTFYRRPLSEIAPHIPNGLSYGSSHRSNTTHHSATLKNCTSATNMETEINKNTLVHQASMCSQYSIDSYYERTLSPNISQQQKDRHNTNKTNISKNATDLDISDRIPSQVDSSRHYIDKISNTLWYLLQNYHPYGQDIIWTGNRPPITDTPKFAPPVDISFTSRQCDLDDVTELDVENHCIEENGDGRDGGDDIDGDIDDGINENDDINDDNGDDVNVPLVTLKSDVSSVDSPTESEQLDTSQTDFSAHDTLLPILFTPKDIYEHTIFQTILDTENVTTNDIVQCLEQFSIQGIVYMYPTDTHSSTYQKERCKWGVISLKFLVAPLIIKCLEELEHSHLRHRTATYKQLSVYSDIMPRISMPKLTYSALQQGILVLDGFGIVNSDGKDTITIENSIREAKKACQVMQREYCARFSFDPNKYVDTKFV